MKIPAIRNSLIILVLAITSEIASFTATLDSTLIWITRCIPLILITLLIFRVSKASNINDGDAGLDQETYAMRELLFDVALIGLGILLGISIGVLPPIHSFLMSKF